MKESYIPLSSLPQIVKRIKAGVGSGGGQTTEIPDATTIERGLMSAADKIKVDCIGSFGIDVGEKELTIGAPNTVADIYKDVAVLNFMEAKEDESVVYDEQTGLFTLDGYSMTADEMIEMLYSDIIQNVTLNTLVTSVRGLSYEEVMSLLGNAGLVFPILIAVYSGVAESIGDLTEEDFRPLSDAYMASPKAMCTVRSFATNIATAEVNGLMGRLDKAKLDSYPFSPDFAASDHRHSEYASSKHNHDGFASEINKQKVDCIGSKGVETAQFQAGKPKTIRALVDDFVNLARLVALKHLKVKVTGEVADLATEFDLEAQENNVVNIRFKEGNSSYSTTLSRNSFLRKYAGIEESNIPADNDPLWDTTIEEVIASGASFEEVLGNYGGDFAYILILVFDKYIKGEDIIDYPETDEELVQSIPVYQKITKTFYPIQLTYTATSTVNGLMSYSDKENLDNLTKRFASELVGSITVTAPTSAKPWIQTTHRLVIIEASNSFLFAFRLTGAIPAGAEIHSIIENKSTETISVLVPNADPYVSDMEVLTIAPGKIGEINAISDGLKIYLRSI